MITGVGRTAFSRSTDAALVDLATQCCAAAIADAGLTSADVDGIACYHTNDSAPVRDVAMALGIREIGWWSDFNVGGVFNCALVSTAAAAISAGLASTVVVYRALRGRSGKRIGQSGAANVDGIYQYMTPFGFGSPPQIFAMTCRRHMHTYGTTRQQLGQVAITMREHARLNQRATQREQLTMEQYLGGRVIADPYTLYDCCQETDGGCALVLTRSERAADAPNGFVRLLSAVQGGGPVPRIPFDGWPDLAESGFRRLATELYSRAGLRSADVDVALLYDAFTFEVIQQLEDFGFCGRGEGGPYVESIGIGLDAPVPVNPHGGLLSEAYIHGLNHVVEAVDQLRGASGSRQVPGAKVALVTGFGFASGSALLLGSKDAS